MSVTEIRRTPGNSTGVESTFTSQGMVIEDIEQPASGWRFRFLIAADAGVENLPPGQAAELGRWLTAQAGRRPE